MAAVNRAAAIAPRHHGRVVLLKYSRKNDRSEVYADTPTWTWSGRVKVGGQMAGMHPQLPPSLQNGACLSYWTTSKNYNDINKDYRKKAIEVDKLIVNDLPIIHRDGGET